MRSRMLGCLLAGLFASTAFAQGRSTVKTGYYSLNQERLAHNIGISSGMMSYLYAEPGLMKVYGWMPTVDLSYRYGFSNGESPMFVGALARYASSKSNTYDGGLQNVKTKEITPYKTASSDSFLDLQLLVGSAMQQSVVDVLEVYGGLGHWRLANSSDGKGSYSRDVNYLYLPMGVDYAQRINRLFTWTAGAEYDMFISGTVVSHTSELSGSQDVTHQQSSGSGGRIRVGGEFRLAQMTVTTTLAYQMWSIDASNRTQAVVRGEETTLVEPQNYTNIYSLNIGARF